jgi:thiamine biosynthesis protein ThiS
MKIKVNIISENKEKEINIKESSLVKDLLEELKINPVTVIVARNNEVISENEKLSKQDKIKILPVISGG